MKELFKQKPSNMLKIGDENLMFEELREQCSKGKKVLVYMDGNIVTIQDFIQELVFKYADIEIQPKFPSNDYKNITKSIENLFNWKIQFYYCFLMYEELDFIKSEQADYVFFIVYDNYKYDEDFTMLVKNLKVPAFITTKVWNNIEEEIKQVTTHDRPFKANKAVTEFLIDFIENTVKVDIVLPNASKTVDKNSPDIIKSYKRPRTRILNKTFQITDDYKSILVDNKEFCIPDFFNKKSMIAEDIKTWEIVLWNIFSAEIQKATEELISSNQKGTN